MPETHFPGPSSPIRAFFVSPNESFSESKLCTCNYPLMESLSEGGGWYFANLNGENTVQRLSVVGDFTKSALA